MNEAFAAADLLLMLAIHPRTGVLIALLLLAAVIDARTYRIPNWLTVGGMVYGVACNALMAPSALSGGLNAGLGLLVGLAVLLPMYLLRVMGAGDVKLMAMVGAFVGLGSIGYAVLFSLIAGGVAALGFAASHRAMRRMFANVREAALSTAFAAASGMRPQMDLPAGASIGRLPYGVSIGAGTITFLVVRQLGVF